MTRNLQLDPERFFVVGDRKAVVVLPSATSPGNFDTGLVVTDGEYLRGLLLHGKALYSKVRLETASAIHGLEVLE